MKLSQHTTFNKKVKKHPNQKQLKEIWESEQMIWKGKPNLIHKYGDLDSNSTDINWIGCMVWAIILIPTFCYFLITRGHIYLAFTVCLVTLLFFAFIIFGQVQLKNTAYGFNDKGVFFKLWRWGDTRFHFVPFADIEYVNCIQYQRDGGAIQLISQKDFFFKTYSFEIGKSHVYPTLEMIDNALEVYKRMEQVRKIENHSNKEILIKTLKETPLVSKKKENTIKIKKYSSQKELKQAWKDEKMLWKGKPKSQYSFFGNSTSQKSLHPSVILGTVVILIACSSFLLFGIIIPVNPILVFLALVLTFTLLRELRLWKTAYAFNEEGVFFKLWSFGFMSVYFVDFKEVEKIICTEYGESKGIIQLVSQEAFPFETPSFQMGKTHVFPTLEMIYNALEVSKKMEQLRQKNIANTNLQ